MEVDARGEVVRHEMHDGVICSAARMTYTAVNAILTERDPAVIAEYDALVPLFERMQELFGVLNGRRRRRGSIDFDLPESQIVLDDEGRVEAVVASERNVAHRLIEEFMLLANETVAAHLEDGGFPAIYRIHEAPDPRKVEEFEAFIATLGLQPVAPRRSASGPRISSGWSRRSPARPSRSRSRSSCCGRCSRRGTTRSTWGTSAWPRRPTPTSRRRSAAIRTSSSIALLRECRRGGLSDARREALAATLPEVARHTSSRERRAMDAERELVQWKKVRFMADKVGDEFDGYVTGVSAFGLFIELVEHFVEGLVHVSTMADDYYRYLDTRPRAAGREPRAGVPARRSRPGAGAARRHRAAADRPRAGRGPRAPMRASRAAARGAAQPAPGPKSERAAPRRRASPERGKPAADARRR